MPQSQSLSSTSMSECPRPVSRYSTLGGIVNVLADEKVLDEKGKVDAGALHAFTFDQMRSGYYAVGEKIGMAWNAGAPIVKKFKK